MSRKRMAPEVKKASGAYKANPGRNPDRKDAPTADGKEPQMPEWFDDDEREMWVYLVNTMRQMNTISSDAKEIATAYCIAYAGYMRARRLVELEGEIIVDDKGRKCRHPILVELHKWRDNMIRLLPDFGLTPASRSKLSAASMQEEHNPFESILSRLQKNN